ILLSDSESKIILMSHKQRGASVTIIGGGFCGLLSAVVCSQHYAQVTVIERGSEAQGVPQRHHIHSLQAKGLQILESLLPGISEDLCATGAVTVRWTEDVQIWLSRGYVPQVDAGVTSIGVSRQHLETCIRERVHALPNVCFKYRHNVRGLICDEESIKGLEVLDREQSRAYCHETSLVLDCSGRQSKTPQWFADIGYNVPEDIRIRSFLGYASRWYRIPDGVDLDSLGIAIQPRPHEGFYRGAAVGVAENDRVVITLVGVNKDYPPTDEVGFAQFAATLAQPVVHDLIQALDPISPISGYRAENRLRPYHKMRDYPDNYLVLGDAFCAFNPIYGQGMMVAAMSAQLLQSYLDGSMLGKQSAATFQRRLSWIVLMSWLLATGEDMRYPLVEGKRPNIFDRLVHRFLDFLFIASNRDQYVGVTLLQVVQRMKSPLYLANPFLLLRALVAILFRQPQTRA
ncbi:MAG: FAD-dependent monooxygenase, partial [Chloroflexota bacterium]